MVIKIFVIILHFHFLIKYAISTQNGNVSFKCGIDSVQTSSEFLYITQINNSNYHNDDRRLDSDGFKDFNIYIETYNLEEEMKQYNLTDYHNIFINSMIKAKETLESLLKVKNPKCYTLSDNQIMNIDINYWDKTKIGSDARKKNISTCTNDIDLIVFTRFGKENELSSSILASAKARYLDVTTRRSIVGVITINKLYDYSKINSKEFLQSLIMHEITHILGFSRNYFNEIYHNVFTAIDKYNITRTYINSTKVVEVARKYFNCPDLEGVELENYGGSGMAGSHWEARILLGDYMNGVVYPEEQVISEFTLAVLEDSGFYKANYYTGGLMRYGKNKGCKFVRDKCINNYEVDPYFENEFYDYFSSWTGTSQSCSSGRQSRTYFAIFYLNSIPEHYRYYSDSKWGGFESADYCPVPRELNEESNKRYYVGHCSKKGNGEYGSKIRYFENNKYKYYKSEELEEITGETYSDHSFCFLSSLTKQSELKFEIYSKTVRAVCYETFCSPKSLTVKIHDNYIVCPRSGGKIQINEYGGFFLCPDYNLICSGTVICNDMFDCVEKKSEIKEDAFDYDYEIHTTQNIERALNDDVDEKYNYELSDEGICIKYCKQCKENKKCIECRKGYGLVGNKENDDLFCLPENEISIGYYKNSESIYYKCIDLCEKCSNNTFCEKCIDNFTFANNICIREISNCENYYLNGSCEKCNDNYAFEGEERDICLNKSIFLNNYYTKDGAKSYYSCDEEGHEHIKNCNKCFFNTNKLKLECMECKIGFFILDNEFNKCYSENELNNNKYFHINSTHKRTCSNQIKNCNECESEEKCIKCQDNFYLINNDTKTCVNINEINPIDEYYLDINNKTTYYSCNNSEYNAIQNCKKCYNNNSCVLCNNGYTFIEGDKTKCFKIEELGNKYYSDPNDGNIYLKCSNLVNNCYTCSSSQCLVCKDGFIFLNDNFSACISLLSIDLNEYVTENNITYYSCKDDKYKNMLKCQNNSTTTNPIIFTTIPIIYSSLLIYNNSYYNENSINTKEDSNFPYIKTALPIYSTIISQEDNENSINTKGNSTFPYIKTTLPIYSTIISQEDNENNINPKENSTFPYIKTTLPIYSTIISHENNENNTTPINESDYPLKIYTIFFLQIQLRENKIYIYIICDFFVPEDFLLIVKLNLFRKKALRFLEEYEKKEIEVQAFPTNKTNNNIFEFSTNLENFINTTKKFYVEMKTIKVDSQLEKNIHYDIILEGNYDNKNTEKVEELIKIGGTNFSKVVNKEVNYAISQYKIKGKSDGCNLILKSNKKINSNRIIILTIMQYNKKSNTLSAECTLSSNNNYEIPCSLDTEGANKYIIKEFIYYNQNEIITIISNNKSSIYPIVCNHSEEINSVKFSKEKRGLSKYHIIIIICSIALVLIIVLAFIICKIIRKDTKRDIPEIVGSTSELKKSNSK